MWTLLAKYVEFVPHEKSWKSNEHRKAPKALHTFLAKNAFLKAVRRQKDLCGSRRACLLVYILQLCALSFIAAALDGGSYVCLFVIFVCQSLSIAGIQYQSVISSCPCLDLWILIIRIRLHVSEYLCKFYVQFINDNHVAVSVLSQPAL